jgi:hypothetical protein
MPPPIPSSNQRCRVCLLAHDAAGVPAAHAPATYRCWTPKPQARAVCAHVLSTCATANLASWCSSQATETKGLWVTCPAQIDLLVMNLTGFTWPPRRVQYPTTRPATPTSSAPIQRIDLGSGNLWRPRTLPSQVASRPVALANPPAGGKLRASA